MAHSCAFCWALVAGSSMADDTPPLELPMGDWHRAKGARMVPFAGYAMPIQYDGIMAEHLWVREHAGLFDVSHMGQILLSGDGLDAAVEAVLPIDLSTLHLGMQRYSLLLAADGGILDDLMVSRWPDQIYLVVNGATKWDDIAYLRQHLPDEITLNHLEDRSLLALQGPKAFAALERHVTGEWPLSALTFMRFGHFELGGVPASISRSGYTGEDGFEISIPATDACRIADLLCAEPEVKPIGLGARDSLRLEAGLPLYGHDLDPSIDPVEANLTFGINKRRRETAGFPGSDRILGAIAKGPRRKLVGFNVDGKMPVREGAPIYAGAEMVGEVTSGGFAPSIGAPIAMGYVATAHLNSPLEAEVRGKRVPLTITQMPFVPHRYFRKGAAK